jgi:GNAT superfamily N-acetyltransferase
MHNDLLIRPATADDTGRILELVSLSLGEGKIPRKRDYWNWKHADSPFGASPCLLAESNGSLVGLRVFMQWQWRAGSSTVRAVRAVDTATHPDWRGKGIFSRLTLALLDQVKKDGISFVFNTPNDQSRPGYLKMGWRSVGRTSVWVRPLRPLRLIRSLLGPGRAQVSASGDRPSMDGIATTRQLMDEAALPSFLEMLRQGGSRLSTPRSIDYLRWRYVAIPGFSYRAAWHFNGAESAVFIFRAKDGGPLRELRLCETLVGPTREARRNARRLLRGVLRDSDADYVTGMAVAGSPEQAVLLGSGFMPAPRLGPIMTVRALNDSAAPVDPLRRSNWQLSAGDLELF